MELASISGDHAQRSEERHGGPRVSHGHLLFANGREYFEIGGLVLSAPEDAPLDQFGYRWPSQIVSFVPDFDSGVVEELPA